MATAEVMTELPIYPSWGIKANSKGKYNYWFGFKNYYTVTSETQYILTGITTSAFVADISVAISLMRDMAQLGVKDTCVLMDKGYDGQAVYKEADNLTFKPIIDLKRSTKNSGEIDEYF